MYIWFKILLFSFLPLSKLMMAVEFFEWTGRTSGTPPYLLCFFFYIYKEEKPCIAVKYFKFEFWCAKASPYYEGHHSGGPQINFVHFGTFHMCQQLRFPIYTCHCFKLSISGMSKLKGHAGPASNEWRFVFTFHSYI